MTTDTTQEKVIGLGLDLYATIEAECGTNALSLVWMVNHGNALQKRADLVGKVLPEWKVFPGNQQVAKRSDGKRLLQKREAEISTGLFLGVEAERVRFEELAEDLLNEYQINNRKSFTWAKRRIDLHLMPFFEGLRALNITTESVRASIFKRQQEGASNGSINRELAALKRMFNLASEMTPPKIGRAPYVPMLKESNVRQGFFEIRKAITSVAVVQPINDYVGRVRRGLTEARNWIADKGSAKLRKAAGIGSSKDA